MNRKATRLAKVRQWQILFRVDDDGKLRGYAQDRNSKQEYALSDAEIVHAMWAGALALLDRLAENAASQILPPPGAA